MELGNKLKALRLKAGVTQNMMAKELGVSSQSVSKWENNVCAPDISMLPKISIYFGVTIDELFDLTVDQKLHRIENMLDFEMVLSDEDFHQTIDFLEEQLETYKGTPGRIYTFLAYVYHHRMASDSVKVSEYARKAMRLHPYIKQDQWLLHKAEGAAICDWNARNHNKTILFYKELVEAHPEIGRNYLYLMDNLLADHRTEEAGNYLDIYRTLEDRMEMQIFVYEARIALAEYKPEAAAQKLREMERQFPENADALFEIAGFHADACEYDEAIRYYEKVYELWERPRQIDPLEGEALIYEIQGKYEEALLCRDRILQNLAEEWGVTEGAPVTNILNEKQRIMDLMKNQG